MAAEWTRIPAPDQAPAGNASLSAVREESCSPSRYLDAPWAFASMNFLESCFNRVMVPLSGLGCAKTRESWIVAKDLFGLRCCELDFRLNFQIPAISQKISR
jgi:hypothetical protein